MRVKRASRGAAVVAAKHGTPLVERAFLTTKPTQVEDGRANPHLEKSKAGASALVKAGVGATL